VTGSTNIPCSPPSSTEPLRLAEPVWRAREQAHGDRVRPWVQTHLDRQARHEAHPVGDFLFEYYSFRPAQLIRWSPGIHVFLENGPAPLSPADFPYERLPALRWIQGLLQATTDRPPQFNCFGLHEWAMIYETAERRHPQLPLRLSPAVVDDFVRSQGIGCTHYDAVRFFTPSARPLNRFQPARATQAASEQPGCLHANMDLYKWAYKFWPWISSELVAEAFELALAARELDMRASPYDLRALGYAPIAIETAAGRAEYQHAQRMLAGAAASLRERLRVAYAALADWSQRMSSL